MLGLALQFGLLWFFIVFFTKETDTQVGMRSALIVVAAMIATNVALALLGTVVPFLDYFRLPIQVAVLYYAVSLVCGHPTRTTLKICGAYLLTTILINIATAILMTPV